MLDIGWTELLLVGVVALIVIGPRDLPGALRTFGKFVNQLRGMARQFQDGLDDIAKQEDIRELQRTVSDVTRPGSIDRYLRSDIDGDSAPPRAIDTTESDIKKIEADTDSESAELEPSKSQPSSDSPADPALDAEPSILPPDHPSRAGAEDGAEADSDRSTPATPASTTKAPS